MVAILFGILVSQLMSGTAHYESCKEGEFKHPACASSKALSDAGKKLCSIQGKPGGSESDCRK